MADSTGLQDLFNFLFGKSILILGFGREGQSSLAFLERHQNMIRWSKLGIADQNPINTESKLNLELHSGKEYLNAMSKYDIVLKSPGISFKAFNRMADYSDRLEEFPQTIISSQIDLVLRFVRDIKIAGISGTKGKSTTSSLLYSIMKETEKPSYLRGNIGVPVFDDIDRMPAGSVLCLELSSHQLEFVQASPQFASLTNFYPEHLDHYQDYDTYLEAKLNILRYQNREDLFVMNCFDQELCRRAWPLLRGKYALIHPIEEAQISKTENSGIIHEENFVVDLVFDEDAKSDKDFVLYIVVDKGVINFKDLRNASQFDIPISTLNPHLRGRHQHIDAAIAACLAYRLGADETAILNGIASFEGLKHRNQWVRTRAGVNYYNDSIATIPQSTILALETLGNVGCLLVGGMDRGLDYQDFHAQLLADSKLQVICLPDTGNALFEYFSQNNAADRAYQAETIEEAVQLAASIVEAGTSVLLSPAASSYHRFKNFEERGDAFITAVNALP